MPDTLELVREAVRDEATKHGIIDPEMVALFDTSKVSVDDDGTANAASVEAFVQRMRRDKPSIFKETDAARLSDANFAALTQRLRSKRSLRGGDRIDGLKRIDAAQLDPHELQSLRGVLSGSGSWHDRSVVEAAARRQNVELKLGAPD